MAGLSFMHPPHIRIRPGHPVRSGLNLLELLVVMAVLGLPGAVAVPALSSLSRSNPMNKSVLILAGICEQARQYAISRNTYVRVVCSPSTPAGSAGSVKVGQVASMDGTDVLGWSLASTPLSGASNLEMAGKPLKLTLVRVEDGTNAAGTLSPGISTWRSCRTREPNTQTGRPCVRRALQE